MNAGMTLVRGLRKQIVDQLRDDLLCGRLREGERIAEQELVARFGVSRTPIREAIAQLSHEGLLEAQPNRGVWVAAPPPDEILELINPMRRQLETFALERIFDDLNDEDFALWDGILARLKIGCKKRDYGTTAECDIAFHRHIIRRTGQPDLEAIWTTIMARLRSHFWSAHRRYEDLMDVYREHRTLRNVFRQGGRQQAVDALGESITPA